MEIIEHWTLVPPTVSVVRTPWCQLVWKSP